MKTYHFISGMPRSGSTLLPAILAQNPDFIAGKASPVFLMFDALREQMSMKRAYGTQFINLQKEAILKGLFYSYYSIWHGDMVFFDKSRAWTARLPQLVELFPDLKMICMVRSPAWILDSCEVLIRKNALHLSGMVGMNADTNVYDRCERLMGPKGMVGYALRSLKEAYYGPYADHLMLIQYEHLAHFPEKTMRAVYNFIGRSYYNKHQFDDVAYQAPDFDMALGTPGLHTVSGPVKFSPRETILPPELFAKYDDRFWLRFVNRKVTHLCVEVVK